MKRILPVLLALLFACAAGAAPTYYATVTTLDDTTPVGPWKVKLVDTSDASIVNYYIAYCLELNEPTPEDGTVYEGVLQDYASLGGVGGYTNPPAGDYLDAATAYLLKTYGQDVSKAVEVQYAIWIIEEEIPDSSGLPAELAALVDGLVDEAMAYDGPIAPVQVLHLTLDQGKTQIQDLAVIPVPAPGAILLAGLGTSVVGLLRRRKSL